jgi:hypothetical protein
MVMNVKTEQRAVIEFLFLEGSDREEIAQYLRNVEGDQVYFRAAVLQWIKKIRNGNEELCHEGPSRRYQYEIDS